ncbi:pro-resilin-like [Aricia agestis]|uniref:pro-resilin-like n=1 Tax=Aricia agestis TaxID=91739 RepID=UPI001C2036C5|nr:pro-resilin-like [Aricia agestis]XP_041988145.1 pro-resilin-like [Aricia agestis]
MWITWGCLVWATLWSTVFAQEYLPPKVNGGGGGGSGGPKKPIPEPVLPANYEFTYDVQDGAVSLDFGHSEKRKDDRASGSYHVLLPDGRTQLVEYEAGPDGFRPQVMYMGTATYPTSGGGSGGGGGGDKFDGYHYNAASNRQSVRTPRPRAPPPPSPAPPPPQLYAPANVTQ